MKTVLVTGSAGFAASHFVDHVIANTDWKIVGLDSFRHRGDSLRVYQDPGRYVVHTHDLATPISHRLIDKIGPVDYIINMASESSVDRSISDPVPFCENNFKLMLNMLEYARVVKPKVFHQVSTDEVPGPVVGGHEHKEWAVPLPSNPYSASKAAQEMLAIAWWRTYSVPVRISRTMNIYGQRQDPEKYIPMLINKIIAGETVTVHGEPNNIGSRFWLHARNHADAILWLIKNKDVVMHSDLVDRPDMLNVVGLREVDNLEMAKLVARILDKPLKYELRDVHLQRPGHDRKYGLDGRAIADLGWVAPVEFERSLRETIQWQRDNFEWLK